MIAHGRWAGEHTLRLEGLQRLHALDDYARWCAEPGSWVGGFDFPFGLPRELVTSLGWPTEWEACLRLYADLPRAQIRGLFKAFCDARPAGGKFAHRATDGPAGSSPSMKWVNPPVAYMLHAGALPLLEGGVHLPGLQAPPADLPSGPSRVALEAYPGLLARAVLGRASYKSDEPDRQTPERRVQRERLVEALQQGVPRLALRLALGADQRAMLLDDASGDCLDAVLCLLQAAWGAREGPPLYGLPSDLDPLEGWIVSAERR